MQHPKQIRGWDKLIAIIILVIALSINITTVMAWDDNWEEPEDKTDQAQGIGSVARDYYAADIKTTNIGNYAITVQSYEKPFYETLPIVGSNYFSTSREDFITEVENNPPSARYDTKPVTKIDIRYNDSMYNYDGALDSALRTLTNELNQSSYGLDVTYNKVETSEEYQVPYQVIQSIGNNNMGANGNKDYVSGSSTSTTVHYVRMAADGYDAGDVDTDIFASVRYVDGRYELIYPEYGWTSDGITGTTYKIQGSKSGTIFTSETTGSWGPSFGETRIYGDTMSVDTPYGKKTIPLQDLTYTVNTYGDLKPGVIGYGMLLTLGKWVTRHRTEYRPTYFSTGLAGMSWRQDAIRFAVYGNHDSPLRAYEGNLSSIKKNPYFAQEVSYLTGNQLYYIGMGSSGNQTYFSNVISYLKNVVNGDSNSAIYMDGTTNTINKVNTTVKDFILSKVPNYDASKQWVLVDQGLRWSVTYEDNEGDPPLNILEHDELDRDFLRQYGISLTNNRYNNQKLLAERWRYRHRPTFYDDDNGIVGFHGAWIEDPIEVFQKPGLYRVNYKRKDNPSYPNMALTDIFDSYRYWSKDYDYKLE